MARLRAYVVEHHAALLAVARRIVRDSHQAEDVVQDTVAACLLRWQADPPRRIGAYVHRAVRLNALRHRVGRRPMVSLDQLPVGPEAESPDEHDWGVTPGELEQTLADLPMPQQSVIRMKYYLGMTFREIGQTLAISSNTAASRCRYGLAALRQAWHKQEHDT